MEFRIYIHVIRSLTTLLLMLADSDHLIYALYSSLNPGFQNYFEGLTAMQCRRTSGGSPGGWTTRSQTGDSDRPPRRACAPYDRMERYLRQLW